MRRDTILRMTIWTAVCGCLMAPALATDLADPNAVGPLPTALNLAIDTGSTILAGETAQLTATLTRSDGSMVDVTGGGSGIVYSSTDVNVLTVDVDGVVTAVGWGTAEVIASVYGAEESFAGAMIEIDVIVANDDDNDGLPNDYEIMFGLDPMNPDDADEDQDEDGLTARMEFAIGTAPNNVNTDGDGATDGEEFIGGTDPLVADVPVIMSVVTTLNENCTVSVLNRTVQVNPDGSFVIDNIPATQTLVRIRALCDFDGQLFGGFSDFFVPTVDEPVDVGPIPLGPVPPSVSSLTIISDPSPAEVMTVGETVQLTVMANLSDGSTTDVTLSNSGSTYIASNPAIISVSDAGLVTTNGGGIGIVSIRNDGVFASIRINVNTGNDRDMDGMPDEYEESVGLNPDDAVDAGLDPDGDGLTNLEEFMAGTDPNVADTDGDGLNDMDELMAGTSPFIGDTDGDGILDGEEFITGDNGFITDPLDPDSDDDGLPDGLEIRLGLNPNNPMSDGVTPDSQRDIDGDGLVNEDELALFTDPGNPDTDGDGLSDGQEVEFGLNPLVPDGMLPIVTITEPASGSTFVEFTTIDVTIVATGAGGITELILTDGTSEFVVVDEVTEGGLFPSTFETTYMIPGGVTQVTLTAVATDAADNTAASPQVTFNVTPDPRTTAVGTVVDEDDNPIGGANLIANGGFTGTSNPDGSFSIPGVPTVLGNIIVSASATVGGINLSGSSASVPPVPMGVTDVGEIVIREAAYETDLGDDLNQSDDDFDAVALNFNFPFFGTDYQTAFVGSNGYITFVNGDTEYTENLSEFLNQMPRICGFWDDLDPRCEPGSVYANQLTNPNRLVATWDQVRRFSCSGVPLDQDNTLQIIIFESGRIQVAYAGMTEMDAIVGVSPGQIGGGTPDSVAVDFSSLTTGMSFAPLTAVYEQFGSAFDLDGGFLIFEPNGGNGYDASFLPGAAPAPVGLVIGVATEQDGTPCADQTLYITSMCDGDFLAEVVTDGQGRYRADDIPFGGGVRVTAPDRSELYGAAVVPTEVGLYRIDVTPVVVPPKFE